MFLTKPGGHLDGSLRGALKLSEKGVTPPGLCVMEMIPGMAHVKLQAMTEPKLQLAA